MEHELDLRATYFVHIHSAFYNAFEKEITGLIRRISERGHDIGLHFDPDYYGLRCGDMAALEGCIQKDKLALESILEVKVSALSFHNPDVGGSWNRLEADCLCGMVNAYAPAIQGKFAYCSDSNGYWRYRPLGDVLGDEAVERLHVLTHPGWWTPEPMPPRARVERCITGRAEKTGGGYDGFLDANNRENIRV
jgi:hypothetical protein